MNVDSMIRRTPASRPTFGGFRKNGRQDLRTQVVVQDAEGWEIPLDTVNLSSTGMFVESDFLFEIGDHHVLIFRSPENGAWLRVEAKVIRVDSGDVDLRVEPPESIPAGMAYEFVGLDAATKEVLCHLAEA